MLQKRDSDDTIAWQWCYENVTAPLFLKKKLMISFWKVNLQIK